MAPVNNVQFSSSHADYRVLADIEAFDHIDASGILRSISLIVRLLQIFVRSMANFCDFVSSPQAQTAGYVWHQKEKIKYRRSLDNVIQSILHWACYSTPSVSFAAIIWRAIPDESNEVWYFADEVDQKYGMLWGDKLNEKTGIFDSKASQVFLSKYMFVSGVAKRPHTLNQQWIYFLGTMLWIRTMLMDSTIRMNLGLRKYIQYSSRWIDLWKLVHDKLDSSVNRVSVWRNKIQSISH